MVCVGLFSLTVLTRNEGWLINMLIGILASLFASYPIAVFFAVTYIIPSQIGVMNMKKTGRNSSSVFFAAQGLVNTIVAAISVNLVWVIGLSGVTLLANNYGYNMYANASGLTDQFRYFWIVGSDTGYGLLNAGMPIMERSQFVMQRTGEYMYVPAEYMRQFREVAAGVDYVRVYAYRFRYVFHGYVPVGEAYYIYNGVASYALQNYLDSIQAQFGGVYASLYPVVGEHGRIWIRQGFIHERGLFGTMFIMPITAVSMLVAFFLAGKLPKRYSTNDNLEPVAAVAGGGDTIVATETANCFGESVVSDDIETTSNETK